MRLWARREWYSENVPFSTTVYSSYALERAKLLWKKAKFSKIRIVLQTRSFFINFHRHTHTQHIHLWRSIIYVWILEKTEFKCFFVQHCAIRIGIILSMSCNVQKHSFVGDASPRNRQFMRPSVYDTIWERLSYDMGSGGNHFPIGL